MSDETTQAEADARRESIDPKLLEVLVCPVTRGPLRYDRKSQELISERAGLAYPIRSGVPIMLREEAREVEKQRRIVPAGRATG